ncbi:hypothetical protein MRX96_047057 [Rhipicephalus microplus]
MPPACWIQVRVMRARWPPAVSNGGCRPGSPLAPEHEYGQLALIHAQGILSAEDTYPQPEAPLPRIWALGVMAVIWAQRLEESHFSSAPVATVCF